MPRASVRTTVKESPFAPARERKAYFRSRQRTPTASGGLNDSVLVPVTTISCSLYCRSRRGIFDRRREKNNGAPACRRSESCLDSAHQTTYKRPHAKSPFAGDARLSARTIRPDRAGLSQAAGEGLATGGRGLGKYPVLHARADQPFQRQRHE